MLFLSFSQTKISQQRTVTYHQRENASTYNVFIFLSYATQQNCFEQIQDDRFKFNSIKIIFIANCRDDSRQAFDWALKFWEKNATHISLKETLLALCLTQIDLCKRFICKRFICPVADLIYHVSVGCCQDRYIG